eukprot:11313981-Heterocapsa_arctica.AAC.1
MGSIILWVRTLLLARPIFGYQVLDETILEEIEMDHNYAEKQAQMQCYDDLIDGYHGNNKDNKEPGYKFDL